MLRGLVFIIFVPLLQSEVLSFYMRLLTYYADALTYTICLGGLQNMQQKIDELLENVEFRRQIARKIPALQGKGAKTNSAIFVCLVLDGPKTVWKINEALGRDRLHYPTILRAVDRLRKQGYIEKVGTVKMEKKKGRTPLYGTTPRGFIASLSNFKVRQNALDVLPNQTWFGSMKLPFDPTKQGLFDFVNALVDPKDVAEFVSVLFASFVLVAPDDIKSTSNELLNAYRMPMLVRASQFDFSHMVVKPREVFKKYLAEHPQAVDYIQNELMFPFEKDIERNQRVFAAVKSMISDMRQGK